MSRIRATFTTHQRQHYCITRRRTRKRGEKKSEYEYDVIRQKLMTDDLKRFNIKTIFVDTYDQITSLLQNLEDRYRRRTIFISGSAADYGEWGQSQTENFVTRLARDIIDKDLRITSGFGLGIGGAVVTGAVQQIYSTRHRSVDEQLVLRPFPIGIKNEQERTSTFHRYREELISQSGIAIFIMGNKVVDGKIVSADGMRSEFDLAKERGLHMIPIGASGAMAKTIWDEVMEKFEHFYPNSNPEIKRLLHKIGEVTDSPEDLIQPVLQLINVLTIGV